MTRRVESITEEDNVALAAQMMRDLNVGALPVRNNENKMTGMITDRDIVVRAIADDKIVAALDSDPLWGEVSEIGDLPPVIRQRLHHSFNTYKLPPGQAKTMSITNEEGRESAMRIIEAATADDLSLIAPRTICS